LVARDGSRAAYAVDAAAAGMTPDEQVYVGTF
jgi:hypothetical protein